MKSCRVRLSHQVSASASIYCKTCHSSKCYTHLLELDSIHSVDAMILTDLHDGDPDWHQHHRDNSQQYEEVWQRVIEDEEKGFRPNASHRLIFLAKTFTTCRAMAPEVTKHGWYDRFVQTISIPVSHYSYPLYFRLHCIQIANNPAKALVGLPDEMDSNEPYDGHTSDGSPSNKSVKPASNSGLMTDPRRMSTPSLVTSSTSSAGIDEVQLLPHSGISDLRSPTVDPLLKSGTPQVLNNLIEASMQTQHDAPSPPLAPCSPLSAQQPPIALSLSPAVLDDDVENLSDLTDLPTEVDSPPRSSMVAIPVSETLEQQPCMELSSSPSSAEGTSSNTRLVAGSKMKSRVVLDFVEISRPEWYGGRRDNITSSQSKRKRTSGPFSSDLVGHSDSDNPPLAAREVSNRSLPKRKRKMSKGPASR